MLFADVAWSQGIEDAWSNVASFVPKFVAFLVILLIGVLVAKIVAKIVDRVLERVGFDRWVERGGVKRAMERSRFDASDLVAKIVYWAIILITLTVAFGVFGQNPISDLLDGVIAYLPKVLAAIIIIVIAAALAGGARDIIEGALGGLSYGRLLARVVAIAIIVVGVFAALNQLQIAPAIVNGLFYAVLATIAGSAIVAIGGGGITPMRERWQRMLQRYDEEMPRVREQVRNRAASAPGTSSASLSPPLPPNEGARPGSPRPLPDA